MTDPGREISTPRWPPRLRSCAAAPVELPALARPPKAGAGRLLVQRGHAAGARSWARRRARSPSSWARRWPTGWGQRSSGSRWPGPGFLNLFMSDPWLHGRGGGGPGCGRGLRRRARDGERVNVEFVSANPTGPITVASGRHAAYGDCAVPDPGVRRQRGRPRVLRERPRRPDRSASPRRSAPARAGEEPPEDGYQGDYVTDAGANRSTAPHELDDDELARRGVELMLAGVRATLERFRVHMDRFVSERALYDDGRGHGRAGLTRGARARVPAGRRRMAAHHDLRRRQGPRADALQRRVHLPRRGHRLPRGQARARL